MNRLRDILKSKNWPLGAGSSLCLVSGSLPALAAFISGRHIVELTKENILEHVDIDPETGCWNWKHGKKGANKRGQYGAVQISGQAHLVHRVVYELYFGLIPIGLCVCHHCDNPPCCNPSHLFLGTKADNNQDMMQKGRFVSGYKALDHRGERNPRAILTDDMVLNIRKQYNDNNITCTQLVVEHNVKYTAIWNVVHRKSWRHV